MYSEIEKNKRKTVLIMVLFFLLVGGIATLFSYLYQDFAFTIYAVIFSIGYLLWGYFGSSKLSLAMNGAHEVTKKQEPRLYRTVENLAITTGMPMPKVYVIEDRAMNAFATGRNPANSSVAATRGLLDALSDVELEGVMAHELGHIKNYDIRVSLIAFAMVSIIGLLCDFFLRISFWGAISGDGDGDEGAGSNPILMVLGVVALILAPLLALLLQMAVSRQREYLADATGAHTTRYPEGLASALEKIHAHGSIMKRQNASTAHFFIANPLKGKSISSLFSTHPPMEDRVRILRGMEDKV
jgi:heat shock protein HtpX